MLSGRKLALTLAFTVLIALAFGVSCRGFFVQPTLTSLAVGPAAPTIETGSTGNTVQMTAFGTYNDGSTGNPAVTWSSAEPSIATVSASGLVTSVSTGTSTITATANVNPTITGSQTVTVTVGCIESIALQPAGPVTLSVGSTPNSQLFAAKATTCNGLFDITDTAIWMSSNTQVATVNAGTVTAVGQGTTNITASAGNIISTVAVVNVGP
jgi:trimeric autotransporter adhesin